MKTIYKLFIFSALFILNAALFAQTKNAAPANQNTKAAQPVEQAQVAPFGEPLFTVYGNLGSITPQTRAYTIENNIKLLKKDALFNPQDLKIEKDEDSTNLVYFGKIILGVTEKQAKMADIPREKLAEEYRNIIIMTLEKERAGAWWLLVARQLGLALLAVAAAFLLIKYLNTGYSRLRVFIWKKKAKTDEKIGDIIDVDKQTRLILNALKWLRVLLTAVIALVCVLVFLSLVPQTRQLAGKLFMLVLVPLQAAAVGFWNYLPDLFSIIVILVIFRIASKILHTLAEKISTNKLEVKGFHSDWAMPTYHLIWVLLLIFTFIFIFPHLPKSNSDVFKGISVFLGVLLSLGSTSIINNVVSGFVITYMRPFKVGDIIKMGEHCGYVMEKSSLVTRLKTPKNEIITIPNSTIMTANTVNYSKSAANGGIIMHAKVAVGYEIDWRLIHQLLIAAATKTQDIMQDPKPFVLQTSLDDFYVQYEINAYTQDASCMACTYSHLYENIQDEFNRAGIELMSPHFHAVRDASTKMMPTAYLKQDAYLGPIKVQVEGPTAAKPKISKTKAAGPELPL